MIRLLRQIKGLPDALYNRIALRRKRVTFAEMPKITGRLQLHGSGRIVLGEDVRIHSHPGSNPVAGGVRTHLYAGSGAELIIGSHTGISHAAITAQQRVEIGEYVLIGSGCMITDTDFHSLDPGERARGEGGTARPVVIRDHAFIGARSILLKGVTVGENSVIGAGSVVTRDVPANEVWAGNPAVKIRELRERE